MPKFTNRDINKKRKETLLSTYDRTQTIPKVRILSKKSSIWKIFVTGQNLDFWHENTPKKPY